MASNERRVLIVGCGDLGIRAGRLLAESGRQVWGLRRRAEAIPSPIHGLGADLGSPESLEQALAPLDGDWDAVIYAVAADRFEDEAYRRAYVNGVENLLGVLERQGQSVRRFVYVSSTSVYAQSDGSQVNESSPTEPAGFGGRHLLNGEKKALDGASGSTVIRFGGIYGPGRERLLRMVKEGKAECYDEPPIWTNRMHVDDCARALAHLVELKTVAPIYLGVDDEPSRDGDVKRWLARRMGVDEPPVAASGPSSTSRRMRSNKRCSNEALKATGFELLYPSFREGYGSLIAD